MSSVPVPAPRVVILAAVDATPASDHVVRTAAAFARSTAGSELHLLHVVDTVPRDPTALDGGFPSAAHALENARAVLDRATSEAAAAWEGRVVAHLAAGTAWREIVQFAYDVQADLIVVGTRDKKGLERLILGSVAGEVVKRAPCAALVARPKDYSAGVPEIEPPCPDCLATQRETAGEKLWCARHGTRHVHARLHYETPPTFGVGSMLLRP